MNKLNPIYIIILFLIIFIISINLLSNKHTQYKEKLKEEKDLKIDALKYNEYTTTWLDKNFIKKAVDDILENRNFKNTKISKEENRDLLLVKMQTNNPKILNEFLNKILNKKLLIKKIEIQKDFISLEIGLKI